MEFIYCHRLKSQYFAGIAGGVPTPLTICTKSHKSNEIMLLQA